MTMIEKVAYGIDWGSPRGDKTMMADVEVLPNGRLRVLSFGEVIEGELVEEPSSPASPESPVAE